MQVGGDAGLEVRVPVEAGPHVVGVSFVRELWEPEGLPQPLQRGRVIADDQVYMDYANVGLRPDRRPLSRSTASREGYAEPPRDLRLPAQRPPRTSAPARRRSCPGWRGCAYRRPVTSADVQTLLEFFDSGRRDGGSFDAGIQFALERMLVDPGFPAARPSRVADRGAASARADASADLEVASRLSFFLWSSIPDERLLSLAEQRPADQARRCSNRKCGACWPTRAPSTALVDNFAAQWLNLRRVDEVVVDPDALSELRREPAAGVQRETELFVGSTLREDRSVLDLLRADYTFVNERLARHYGIPGIYGSRFRRVTLPESRSARRPARAGRAARDDLVSGSHVAGAARQMAAEQHLRPARAAASARRGHQPARTSRARPPASIRERLAQHRQNPIVQQLSFGDRSARLRAGELRRDRRLADRWTRPGKPVDASGTTVSGDKVDGLAGLRALLLQQPEQFPRTRDRKAAGVCARPQARVLRSAGGAADRPRRRGRATTAGRRIILGIVQESRRF